MTDLPPTWSLASIDEVGDITTGNTPSKKNPNNYGNHCPWVKPPDLGKSTPVTTTEESLSQIGAAAARVIPAGSVMVCCIGSLGKVGLAGVPVATNQQINSVSFDDRFVNPRYGFYYCQTLTNWLNENASATTVAIVNKGIFSRAPLVLAPRQEQDRIVAEIEKQFTRLDDAVAALKRVQANLKRYRASVLKAACEGRLVPTEAELARKEGRDYEPASELLRRILAERRAKWESDQLQNMIAPGKLPKNEEWKKKYQEPEPPTVSPGYGLPPGWIWVSIIQVAFVNSGQTPKGIESRLGNKGDIPWFKVGDMNHSDNQRLMRRSDSWLSRADLKTFGLHVQPPGTIIFPKRGGAIATNKKRILSQPSCYDLNTMGITPNQGVQDFVWFWFQSIDLGRLGDGSNVPQINHGDIEPLALPLPPFAEQRRIVNQLDARLSTIDQMQNELKTHLARATKLRESLLRTAFTGKLLPQDPNDEPASMLLERIRAERDAHAANGNNYKGTARAGSADTQHRRRGQRLAQPVSAGKPRTNKPVRRAP